MSRVKSFFIFFIILLGFACYVFYTGWTQFKVKNNNVGVIQSKTSGTSEDILVPGSFSWSWVFLIPSNAEVLTFRSYPYEIKKNLQGELPSGDVYASLLGGANADFSYNIDFDIKVSVPKENLKTLIVNENIRNDEGMENYIKGACDEITKEVFNKLLELSSKSDIFLSETLDYESILKDIDSVKKYPLLSFDRVTVKNLKLPDCELYLKAKKAYYRKLENQGF